MRSPRALILAGPNGAGKTTFAREFLITEADCPAFINADLIAEGLSPFDPALVATQAMSLMAKEMRRRVRACEDFSIESTLAGRTYIKHIRQWQRIGYSVKIIFLRLPDVELALRRVRMRVAQGGHDIPDDVVARRFERGRCNFCKVYRPMANSWQVYDASHWPPTLEEQGGDG